MRMLSLQRAVRACLYLGTLYLGALWLPSPASAEIPGFAGGDARVVVFDASGSMRKQSFERLQTPRIDVARDVLKEVFGQLQDMGDPTPTALSVFGAVDAWDDYSATFGGDPARVPQDHPLCRDIETVLDFAIIDSAVVAQARTLADGLKGRGMTPIHQSLLQGLRAFTGGIGGATLQFVLISDLDNPNCLPDGLTICQVLQDELDRIRNEGGKVEAVVFETPVAAIRKPLSQCMPVSTYVIGTEDPDPPGKVEEAFDTLALTPVLTVLGASLDPGGIRTDTARYEISDTGTGGIVASGPHGVFDLAEGSYVVLASVDGQSVSTPVDIDSDMSLDIALPAARLSVDATTNGAPGPTRLVRLDIRRPGGAVLASVADYAVGSELALANGEYELTGQDSAGQTASATVTLTLGKPQAVTLNFGAAAAATAATRSVIFDIVIVLPTLPAGSGPAPTIALVHPGGQRDPLPLTGYSANLGPGTYEIHISGSVPHVLPFDVTAAPDALRVAVHVTPGWFVAQSTQGPGSFELLDAGGSALFSFDDAEVVHSLPEGRYALVFKGADGTQTRRDFDIRAGEETPLAPF